MTRRSIPMALLPLLAAGSALAEPSYPPGVTLAQFENIRWVTGLAHADTDRDGRISKAELRVVFGARGPLLDLFWGQIDVNRNGFLDRAESDTAVAREFRRADANRDGALSPAEARRLPRE